MSERLTLRQDYFGDPEAFQALADLLQTVFGIDISLQRLLGGPDPTSMPAGYFDQSGRCVANFSAFSMPLIVNGRIVRAAGYQSGAVLPEFRGRGLYQNLMRRTFARAKEEGFESGILLTDKPDLYRPFGFTSVPQFHFRGVAPRGDLKKSSVRDLNVRDSNDLRIIQQILVKRQPVSEVFAPARQAEMFLLNSLFDPAIRLSLLSLQECVVAWKACGDGVLQLLDIVASKLPPLSEIHAAFGNAFREVEVHFPVDRLEWRGEATAHRSSCVLMLQGIDPAEISTPFMLSPMADF